MVKKYGIEIGDSFPSRNFQPSKMKIAFGDREFELLVKNGQSTIILKIFGKLIQATYQIWKSFPEICLKFLKNNWISFPEFASYGYLTQKTS